MEQARAPMGLRKDIHIEKILKNPEISNKWSEVYNRPFNKNDIDNIYNDFVPLQLECLAQYSNLIPGTENSLNKLKKKYDLSIGVTTGFSQQMCDIIVSNTKKQGFIPDAYIGGDAVSNNMGYRPSPFMIYENMKLLGTWYLELNLLLKLMILFPELKKVLMLVVGLLEYINMEIMLI